MLCHFSITTQLYHRLHQIPQGKQLQGRRTGLACDEESLVAGSPHLPRSQWYRKQSGWEVTWNLKSQDPLPCSPQNGFLLKRPHLPKVPKPLKTALPEVDQVFKHKMRGGVGVRAVPNSNNNNC